MSVLVIEDQLAALDAQLRKSKHSARVESEREKRARKRRKRKAKRKGLAVTDDDGPVGGSVGGLLAQTGPDAEKKRRKRRRGKRRRGDGSGSGDGGDGGQKAVHGTHTDYYDASDLRRAKRRKSEAVRRRKNRVRALLADHKTAVERLRDDLERNDHFERNVELLGGGGVRDVAAKVAEDVRQKIVKTRGISARRKLRREREEEEAKRKAGPEPGKTLLGVDISDLDIHAMMAEFKKGMGDMDEVDELGEFADPAKRRVLAAHP